MFLYKTYVLPKLDYASSIWFPYYKKDVDLIESVRRKFSKFLPDMIHKSYCQRLMELKLTTLEERRIHLDLILMYKIYYGLVDVDLTRYSK